MSSSSKRITLTKPDGVEITVKIVKPAKPSGTILFVHGLCSDLSCWKYQQKHCGKTYRTISFDLRRREPFTFQVFVDDILFLLKELNVSSFIWVGADLGGLIGITYVASSSTFYPNVEKLVLVNSNPYLISDKEDWPYSVFTLKQFNNIRNVLQSNLEYFATQWTDFIHTTPVSSSLRSYTYDTFLKVGSDVFEKTLNSCGKENLIPLLPKVSVKTLIIFGSKSLLAPKGSQGFLLEDLPDAHIYEVYEASSLPYLTHSDEFNTVLSFFLQR